MGSFPGKGMASRNTPIIHYIGSAVITMRKCMGRGIVTSPTVPVTEVDWALEK